MKSIAKLISVSLLISAMVSIASFAVPSALPQVDVVQENNSATDIDKAEEIILFGEGTQESPYEISSAEEFNEFSSLIKSDNSQYGSKYYKLMSNVDFENVTIVPFGTASCPFTGTFDGNGYSIFNVSVVNTEYSGVIGYMKAGAVKNLSVSYNDMTTRGNYSTLKYFGGIVGSIVPKSSTTVTIDGCFTEGSVVLYDSNTSYLGGIAGHIKAEIGNVTVSNCVSTMSFDANTVSDSYAGGFVSYASASSSKDYSFKNCLSFGNVKLVTNGTASNAAGFAAYTNKDESGWSGWASDEEAELAATVNHFDNCAAFGDVYGESPVNVYIGGFIAKTDGAGTVNLSDCYKNSDQSVSGSTGTLKINTLADEISEETFKTEAFYSDTLAFDFENIWYMSIVEKMPRLRTVAKAFGGSDVYDSKDLRLNTVHPGIRFKAGVEVFKRDYCFEYGFIVARKDELGSDELTFDYTGRIVSGIAYNSGTDLFLEKNDETITFTGVVYNIPSANYDVELVARAYVKFVSDGETVIVYGDSTSSSVNLSATAIRNSESYEYLSNEQKALLETMLTEA